MQIRQRIIAACQDITRIRGFRNFTMDELAAQAGVSKRTLYRRFRSKDEVVEATLHSFIKEIRQSVDELLQEPNPVRIVNELLNLLMQKGQFMINPQSLYDIRYHYPNLWSQLEKIRQERIAQVMMSLARNSHVSDLEAQILTAVITSSIQTVLSPGFILDHNITFEEAARQLSHIILAVMQASISSECN